MTGRGLGDCQGTGLGTRPIRGGGRGLGAGRGFGGRGAGRGIGLRMRNRVFAQNVPVVDNVATEDIDELYNQVETLKEQVAELTSLLTKAKVDKDQNT
jgi:hypothetical protein